MATEEMTTYPLRLPAQLKKDFLAVAKANDQDAAKLLRAFVKDYLKKHAQGDLLRGK